MPKNFLEAKLLHQGIEFATDAPVSNRLVASRARLVVSPRADQLPELISLFRDTDTAFTPYGSGSNTLLRGTDTNPLGTVLVTMDNIRGVRVDALMAKTTVGAGTPIAKASKYSAAEALAGLEFARDIPGTTAGAIATDAGHPILNYADRYTQVGIEVGTQRSDIRDVLAGVHVVDGSGTDSWMPVEALGMRDRRSRFLDADNDLIIAEAVFDLEAGDQTTIDKARTVVYDGRHAMRCRNRALNPHSVGRTLGFSFVLNHPSYGGVSAAKLIATAESLPPVVTVDGMTHSTATANIIANAGDGTPDGYLHVADIIQDAVAKDHGIAMPLEVRVIS